MLEVFPVIGIFKIRSDWKKQENKQGESQPVKTLFRRGRALAHVTEAGGLAATLATHHGAFVLHDGGKAAVVLTVVMASGKGLAWSCGKVQDWLNEG
jgi:hypothetical protein